MEIVKTFYFLRSKADATPKAVGVNPYNRKPLTDKIKKEIIKKLEELKYIN